MRRDGFLSFYVITCVFGAESRESRGQFAVTVEGALMKRAERRRGVRPPPDARLCT